MEIRGYSESDSHEIADIFHGSVHSICTDIYTESQLNAWSPSPLDYSLWVDKLRLSNSFVAVISNVIVGFIEIDGTGFIDCLYVHPEYQRQGVASELLSHAISLAAKHGVQDIRVEASVIAQPLFKKFGFVVLSKNIVTKNGQNLINFSMRGASKP